MDLLPVTANGMRDLYATGFNAWNQLNFHDDTGRSTDSPNDLRAFEIVLKQVSLGRIHASISCTYVTTAAGVISAGYPDEWASLPELKDNVLNGRAAIAGNGKIAVYDGGQAAVHQYQSIACFERNEPQHSFSGLGDVVQVVAYETGFAALSSAGRVWTWGDARYGACLGRDVSAGLAAADQPGEVTDLSDLPTGSIRKLAAGGYLLMALTEGQDLYAWGRHPGRPPIIDGLSDGPTPLVVEEKDIRDCAVGEAHAILLATDGSVYVIGENANGQLGLPGKSASTWTQVFAAPLGISVLAVAAGPRSSYVVTRAAAK